MATGRPRAETEVVRVVLTLHPDYDHDLLEFFRAYPPGSKDRQPAIKTALRGGLPQGNVEQAEIDEEDVLDALSSMVF